MDAELLRRWWRDHGSIDRALEDLRLDLAHGSPAASDERIAELAAALEHHFATEEELYFPLAARTWGQSARLLERAHQGHQQLRETLADLRVLLQNAEVDSAQRTFDTLLQRLQTHEEEEVAILVELERLVSPSLAG